MVLLKNGMVILVLKTWRFPHDGAYSMKKSSGFSQKLFNLAHEQHANTGFHRKQAFTSL